MRALTVAALAALALVPAATRAAAAPTEASAGPPIYVAFLWHMHQPIYWPYESILQTEAAARYDYSVVGIHDQRVGPYTSWPKDAVEKGIAAGMGHFGAQVSLTGSLIENLDHLEAGGSYNFQGWKNPWNTIRAQSTVLGNPRMDLVGFGYHHPLMGLIETVDLRRQIQAHRARLSGEIAGVQPQRLRLRFELELDFVLSGAEVRVNLEDPVELVQASHQVFGRSQQVVHVAALEPHFDGNAGQNAHAFERN